MHLTILTKNYELQTDEKGYDFEYFGTYFESVGPIKKLCECVTFLSS